MTKDQQRLPFDDGEYVGRAGQLSLPLEHQAPTAPVRKTLYGGMDAKRSFANGGALGLGRRGNPTAGNWDEVGPSQSKAEHTARGAATQVHSGQFQMFMTPREIRSKYQALDADREEHYDERGGEMTRRPETTAGSANVVMNDAERSRQARWHGGKSQIASYGFLRNESYAEETDDQLFNRKLEESQMDPAEYREVHGGEAKEPPGWDTLARRSSAPSGVRDQAAGNYSKRAGEGSSTWDARNEEAQDYVYQKGQEFQDNEDYGPSLHDRIRSEGVQKPVHLSIAQMGSMGLPQIVGGHHRLAAQQDINPDQPIPVKHWESIWEAKKSGTYS